jgi:hypothetical protein
MSGPGCTNLVTGFATANSEGMPVVGLGGAVPRAQRLKQAHQSLDTVTLFKPITKYSAEVAAPEAIGEVLEPFAPPKAVGRGRLHKSPHGHNDRRSSQHRACACAAASSPSVRVHLSGRRYTDRYLGGLQPQPRARGTNAS